MGFDSAAQDSHLKEEPRILELKESFVLPQKETNHAL